METFSPRPWHEGELFFQRRIVDRGRSDPTTPFLAARYANWIQQYPALAMGTLDDNGNPWCTVWGTNLVPFVKPVAQSVLGVQATVDASFDPVVQAICRNNFDMKNNNCGTADKEMEMGGVSIHLEERARVKLAGQITAATLKRLSANRDVLVGGRSEGAAGELHLIVRIDQSLGNCPKYLNKKHIVAHIPRPKLLSTSPHLPQKAIEVVHNADAFFIASSHKHRDMDCNYRGGPPGFIRIVQPDDSEEASTIVWPEYSGNALYQTLGNLRVTPQAGLVIPNFETGDVLYVTGNTKVLLGTEASNVIAKSTVAVALMVTDAKLVENGLPFRAKVVEDGAQGRSPYNPRVRYLTSEEIGKFDQVESRFCATARMIKKTRLTPTITKYNFTLVGHKSVFGSWKPGQYVTMDASASMTKGYSHMRDDDPTSLNDDFIRTFTITSLPSAVGEETEDFEVMIRSIGSVTKWLEHQKDGICEVAVRGIGGDFTFASSACNAFIAAGIGITPLLSHLDHIHFNTLRTFWSVRMVDIGLPLAILRDYPALIRSTTIYLTGFEALPNKDGGKGNEEIQRLIDTGVLVQQRRLCKEDLQPCLPQIENWYVCTAPTMRRQVHEWLPGTVIHYENFDF
ncbi:hypothetical protein PV08_09966 [Exophiala spinifera]|uniref:FAD-binding FR-type domain-containing protein n=1 Tax=Exophiala spinifera TaxID=91928 RepID=A0A0D2B193_9EURO|nr:uncharacterized protein PV08_09966 [Exophiala spinifera]KIW12688.1 hypothetical protein PV08_09966 [Exophiala spinifera]